MAEPGLLAKKWQECREPTLNNTCRMVGDVVVVAEEGVASKLGAVFQRLRVMCSACVACGID